MILLDLLFIHIHSRLSFPGVVFLPQVSCIFYFPLLFYFLGYLFASCVYIHLLHIVFFLFSIFIVRFACSSVDTQAIPILPFLPSLSSLTHILFTSSYFSSSLLSLCSLTSFVFRSIICFFWIRNLFFMF